MTAEEIKKRDEEIFNYFDKHPTSSFVEITENITVKCDKSTVRRVLLRMGDRKLSNGLTVKQQLELKKKDQKEFLNFVFYNPTSGLMDIVNSTGISIDKVSHYFTTFKDYVLSNGNTLEQQRILNRKQKDDALTERKQGVLNYFLENPESTYASIARNFSISNVIVKEYLDSFCDVIVPSTGLTVSEQIKKNNNRYNELKGKIIDYFNNNPTTYFSELSRMFNCSKNFVRDLFLNNLDYKLKNGLTIGEQLEKNYSQNNEKKLCVLGYFLENPESTYSSIARDFSISHVTVKEWLIDFGDALVPSTGLTVSEQIVKNKNKYNEIKDKIIDYFNNNPSTSLTELSRIFNCNKAFVWNLFQDNLDFVLYNGLTIREQLSINNHHNDEKLIVDYFRTHYTISLTRLAIEIDSDLDSIRNYLYKHVGERLDNGLTIGEQLNKNNTELWHHYEDIIPDSGVFIKNRDGSYRGLITEIDGFKVNLRDSRGKKISTIVVSNDFEDKLVKEAISYVLRPGVTLDDFALSIGKEKITISNHFAKIKTICPALYELVKDNITLSKKNMSGDATFYYQNEIDNMCLFMIQNNFDIHAAALYFHIQPNTMENIVKRASPEIKEQLDKIINDNDSNVKVSFK